MVRRDPWDSGNPWDGDYIWEYTAVVPDGAKSGERRMTASAVRSAALGLSPVLKTVEYQPKSWLLYSRVTLSAADKDADLASLSFLGTARLVNISYNASLERLRADPSSTRRRRSLHRRDASALLREKLFDGKVVATTFKWLKILLEEVDPTILILLGTDVRTLEALAKTAGADEDVEEGGP